MYSINPIEYRIHLHTDEWIDVSEFDPASIQCLHAPGVMESLPDITALCSKIPRPIIEEAKLGYSQNFVTYLKTPPVGALLRFPKPRCAMAHQCSLFDAKKCTTRNITPSRNGGFPICWEFLSAEDNAGPGIRELAFEIVHAWRRGRHAILVDWV